MSFVLVVLAAGCGGKAAVCGDGIVDSGEDCDLGAKNGLAGFACSKACKSVSVNLVNLSVTWTFNLLGSGDPVPGYQAPGCSNFGATKAHVLINGPSPTEKVVDCTRYTLKYPTCLTDNMGVEQCDDKPNPGKYQATVTLEREDGTAVTTAVSTPTLTVNAGPEVSFPVAFEMQDFLKQDFTGTLDFHASWGAPKQGCTAAGITDEYIMLIPDGVMTPLSAMTKLGTRTDGSAPGMCFTSDMMTKTFEQIDGLPWGRYRLAVYSLNPSFCASTPVFVNPGMFNSTYELVVPPYTPPPMPDGGVGDGGVEDGGAGPTCP